MTKFYVASKSRHGAMWKEWRARGVPIASRWIDKWDQGRFPSDRQTAHWNDILQDIHDCDAVVVYAERDDILKGALAEWGIGFALSKQLYYVGPVEPSTFTGFEHHLTLHSSSLAEVFLHK